MWKYTKVWVNPRRGNTRFHMWKFTRDRVLPHVEIHQKLWISQHAEIHIFWCISTCGNSSGKVNFRMSVYKLICEFPRGKTCGNTCFFADFRMRKYTRICEFPRAEIHAERCITACGNTLTQVQKNSSFMISIYVPNKPNFIGKVVPVFQIFAEIKSDVKLKSVTWLRFWNSRPLIYLFIFFKYLFAWIWLFLVYKYIV